MQRQILSPYDFLNSLCTMESACDREKKSCGVFLTSWESIIQDCRGSIIQNCTDKSVFPWCCFHQSLFWLTDLLEGRGLDLILQVSTEVSVSLLFCSLWNCACYAQKQMFCFLCRHTGRQCGKGEQITNTALGSIVSRLCWLLIKCMLYNKWGDRQ